MSRTVTVELTDEEYARIERAAAATSRTPAEVTGAAVRQHRAGFDSGPDLEPEDAPGQFSGPITAAELEAALRKTAAEIAARTGEATGEIIARIDARIRATPTSMLSDEEREVAR
ncbi:MAG: hypothetical protein IT340_09810 [Chloroflexi bacterium]|nr:hypothetical protein [Chloroflexota bacterium]